ncbi:hypothetical protein EON64_05575 [archaeon]|nr:MAG: hypothetical protein EON64_05575 [archaeon]
MKGWCPRPLDDGDKTSAAPWRAAVTSVAGASRLALLKRVWNSEYTKKGEVVGNIQDIFPQPYKRGILFVPDMEHVHHTIGLLRAWRMGGLDGEIVDLLSVFGIEQIERRKKGTKVGSKGSGKGKDQMRGVENGIRVQEKDRSTSTENTHSAGLAGSVVPSSTTKRTLFVAPFSGTRGLHLPDLDCVFIVEPPRTMDEYLHLAGRTGRLKPHKDGVEETDRVGGAGTVVVVTNQDGVRKLQGWQTSLDINFDLAFG